MHDLRGAEMTRKEARKLFDENFNFKGVFLSYQQDEELHKIIREALDEEYWHTGEPTEEGWYVVAIKDDDEQIKIFPTLCEWKNKSFHLAGGVSDFLDFTDKIVAWHKIPPFEEKK